MEPGHNDAPSGTKMCSKCRIAGSGRGDLTQLAAVICCFGDRGAGEWRKKKKEKPLIRHIVLCAFCLFFPSPFFRCAPVMGAILRDGPLCSGAPTEWPIVSARWAQDRSRRGDGLRQERRQRRRRNRGGTDTTKGINECGCKRLAGTREAVQAE